MFKSLNNLHHAYLLVGDKEAAESSLLALFDKEGQSLVGSPDYFVFKEPLFGVDDARALTEQAIRRAFTQRKVFFIAPERITLEAQNALLKTFEEPIANTHFFLAVSEESVIIPTLLSRLKVLHVQHRVLDKEAENFLKLSVRDRLNFVKKFVDKEKDLSAFLDDLLLELRHKSGSMVSLEQVYKLRLLSNDRGASPRLILEHLSVVL